MREQEDRSLDQRLRPAKIKAGWITVAFLLGMVYIAVDRDLNHRYLPAILAVLAVLVTGLLLARTRRAWWRRPGGRR